MRGQVQGVGFRPFVWQLANQFNIVGTVCNDPEGVLVLAAGDKGEIADFLQALKSQTPPLAQVDSVEVKPFVFDDMPVGFEIIHSSGQGAETRVTPDAATCPQCVADIFGSDPRRARYAFTNCTNCGPRFTIITGLPYDRANTSMAHFQMCDDCAGEYDDPSDRRFHAQPVACVACGPRLWFEQATGAPLDRDVIEHAAGVLERGGILAIKGLGGFHLCCDATNADAVQDLRQRKHRPTKPLALMGTLTDIKRFADAGQDELTALNSPAAPIVLLKTAENLPNALAPGQSRLGWMLPYTPLHHLLLDALKNPLVMTSGNLSGEPQVIKNEEAREKLGSLVDGFVMHDRDITRRLDDSVERHTRHGPVVLRRARGHAPETLPLPQGFENAPQVVAFGGHLKSAICVIKNGQALLSHHLGDLDDALTWDEFLKADADYAQLFDHAPSVFACDMHPDYRSSGHARERAGRAPLIEVQHHHAHLAACLADNGWPLDGGRVAGIVLDGLGMGPDATVWGGELLLADYTGFERVGHLPSVPLVGGDMAQREPWRNAVMQLDRAGLSDLADRLFAQKPLSVIRQAANRGVNSVPTSSAGRLFDAVAAVIGLCPDSQTFEGEAAMQLEAVAIQSDASPYPFGPDLSPVPMFRAMADDIENGRDRTEIAWRFHAGLAAAFAHAARTLVESGRAQAVACSGGCFQNALLLNQVVQRLGNVPVLIHKKTPANDGGLALGQAVIAAAQRQDHR